MDGLTGLFGHNKSCCGTATDCCTTTCCNADPCEIAKLIYQSQTACYAKDRKSAIDELGDNFNCACNPEIMTAFIYALNDSDEDVRKEAADEIGDQLRKNPCCCSPELTAALTCSLGDCDRGVVRQAEEALEACGYEIVDGCCDPCCTTACATSYSTGTVAPSTAPAAPAEPKAVEPTPAPPESPEAYFPSRIRSHQSSNGKSSAKGLAGLFSLVN
ncbi:HEAT repeat domain-containing protein [Polystyrenella longa]|uniref:HEAT repeat domain-containing protein n=1 Tax=Polystyrenella longa TaxID=2528007 RepID=UPI001E297E1F|nr:HEAT repeat domain-containing protein [Polystyrenella longa]